jgi:uncharacterized protein (TIGR03067 family)
MRPTAILLALVLVVTVAYSEDKPVKPITPAEAAKKINEKVTVELVVKSTGGKTATFLNSEEDFKSDKNLPLFISEAALEKFKKAKIDDPKTFYRGKTVHATGTVTLYKEKPEIKIEEPDQIKVIEKKDAEKKEGSDDAKKEMTLLEGEWSMVSGEASGQALPAETAKTGKRSAKDGGVAITFGERVYFKAKYTIDPTKKPKAIDYTMTEGTTKGKTHLGIYELNGDTVKFCFAAPDKDRPTEFTSKEGSGWTLSIWKRDKK